MSDIIQNLKNQHLIWQANHAHQASAIKRLSSGFSALDDLLGGGLPISGVIEVETSLSVGELRLFSPYMAHAEQKKLTAFISPPGVVTASYLSRLGLDLNKIWVIDTAHSDKTSECQHRDALWSAEQCLKSGACDTVFLWVSELEIHQVKRLMLAADQGNCLLLLLMPIADYRFSLPVTLSLSLEAHPSGLYVEVTKHKGGWKKGKVFISLEQQEPLLALSKHKLHDTSVIPFPIRQQS